MAYRYQPEGCVALYCVKPDHAKTHLQEYTYSRDMFESDTDKVDNHNVIGKHVKTE